MSFFSVDIYTPSKIVAFDLPASSVVVPTLAGEINILPEHTHVIERLDTGTMRIINGKEEEKFIVTSGICKVLRNKITVLSVASECAEEIDVERAKRALQEAQEFLKRRDIGEDEARKFRYKVKRAEHRLRLAQPSSK